MIDKVWRRQTLTQITENTGRREVLRPDKRRELGNPRMWEKERDAEERIGDWRHSRESPELSHRRRVPRDDRG